MPYDAYRLSKAILNNFYCGMISSIIDSMHCKIAWGCNSHKPVCTHVSCCSEWLNVKMNPFWQAKLTALCISGICSGM